jgi:hypothetical protein
MVSAQAGTAHTKRATGGDMAHTIRATYGGLDYAVTFHAVAVVIGWDSHSKRETFRAVCSDCGFRGGLRDTSGGAEHDEVRHQDDDMRRRVAAALGRVDGTATAAEVADLYRKHGQPIDLDVILDRAREAGR